MIYRIFELLIEAWELGFLAAGGEEGSNEYVEEKNRYVLTLIDSVQLHRTISKHFTGDDHA